MISFVPHSRPLGMPRYAPPFPAKCPLPWTHTQPVLSLLKPSTPLSKPPQSHPAFSPRSRSSSGRNLPWRSSSTNCRLRRHRVSHRCSSRRFLRRFQRFCCSVAIIFLSFRRADALLWSLAFIFLLCVLEGPDDRCGEVLL